MRGIHTCVLLCLLACCVTWTAGKRISTRDIQKVLKDYDKYEPPRLDGPTDVRIGIYMNNLLLHYDSGILRMSMYLRMAWQDKRLKGIFNDTDENEIKRVTFGDEAISSAWRPDIFVRNADAAERVDALQKEHLFRVNRTGHVWYVVRLIHNVYCPSLLSGYTTIMCPIMFESFSYTMDTLTLSWLSSAMDVDPGLNIPTHKLKDLIIDDCSQNYTAGAFPCLEIRLVLERIASQSTFEAGIYIVSIILIFISWLGFWIPPTEKRVFLGLLVTLILSVLYTSVAEWREFSYADRTTHAQIWIIFSLFLVLAMVLEFLIVYILFGTLRARLRGLCGGSPQPEDLEPKRSRCGDIVDSVFGLVIFPGIFIIALISFGLSTLAFV